MLEDEFVLENDDVGNVSMLSCFSLAFAIRRLGLKLNSKFDELLD
jgi:hypothetical protein